MSNQLLIKSSDGTLTEIKNIPGLEINFLGKDSRVILIEGSTFNFSHIKIDSDSEVYIDKTRHPGMNHASINMEGSPGSKLKIGRGFFVWGCYFAMANEANLSLTIGDDCMFASGITFRCTDGHTIIDKSTNEIINHSSPTYIGNHVWVGANATILKGSLVPDNSIVATSAVITKKYDETNIILAGNPARIVKHNIEWDKKYIDKYIEDEGLAIPKTSNNIRLNKIQYFGSMLFGIIITPFINKKKVVKLYKTPFSFFNDSKNSFTRVIGKLLRII